jgi:hypothetical protein
MNNKSKRVDLLPRNQIGVQNSKIYVPFPDKDKKHLYCIKYKPHIKRKRTR